MVAAEIESPCKALIGFIAFCFILRMSKELEKLANELLKEHEASQVLKGNLQKATKEAAASTEVMCHNPLLASLCRSCGLKESTLRGASRTSVGLLCWKAMMSPRRQLNGLHFPFALAKASC